MINRVIAEIVLWCWRHWISVSVGAAVATLALGWFALSHLGLDTDENKLLSSDLPFRKAERQMSKAFPDEDENLVVVIDAPTAGQAEDAAEKLLARLERRTDLFVFVRRPPGTTFFQREGLLYLSVDQLQNLSDRLVEAQPMLGTLARDPSLRGVLSALDLMLMGMEHGEAKMTEIAPAIRRFADTAGTVAAGHPKPLSWGDLMGSSMPMTQPMALILARARLDYSELMPGEPASNAIRFAAADLGYTPDHGYRVRLTGSAALTDDNFATVTEGVELSTPLSIAAVVLILFAAVRSKRLVAIILGTLAVGLAATGAFAAASVHKLNPISVGFAVMFVGIAVDFAIQFVIRYRDMRWQCANADGAMRATASSIVGPLSLAAASTAVGFLSFVPTDYVGVSQLGIVAGAGMLIALAVDLTLLPALLRVARPPGENESVGMPLARGIDRFLARHARPVVAAAVLLGVVGAVMVPRLKLDFNPLDLQNPKAEAVSTLRSLMSNPETSPYSIDMLAPTLDAAQALVEKFNRLPEVDHAVTLTSFVPEQQDEKLAILNDLASLYAPTMSPEARRPPPTIEESIAAMERTAANLRAVKDDPDGQAHRLADLLDTIRAAGPDRIDALGAALLGGLPENLTILRRLMNPTPVALGDLPESLVRDWVAKDGQIKVSVWPKGDMQNEHTLRRFVHAVQPLAPGATGMPVSIVAAGDVVVSSFARAGFTALGVILVLLGLMLRRVLDALLVVLPLVLGGLYTVIGCVVLGLPINFANIIALPLLLGIGVAFNIYFVVNWRHGVQDHLETSTSRAVLFSALTTSSAFGSLAVSPHMGMASMGLLLFLSVGLSVATTFLVLPAIFHLLPRKPVHA
ncbi:MAG: MMPL family transporter [Magnetospirillum sp.]|nr:MMPL family transporter [Magnetospirillum sp.]